MKNASQYSLAISDLIMGFLFIFILLLMKFMLEYENKKEELLLPLEARSELLKGLKKEIENKGIKVKVNPKTGVLKLKNVKYFKKGSYQLSQKGREDMRQVKEILQKNLICYSDLENDRTKSLWLLNYGEKIFEEWKKHCAKNKSSLLDSVLIEGHADPTPIGRYLKSKGIKTNMDLAMRRSQAVFQLFTDYEEATIKNKERGGHLYFLSNGQGKPLFGVVSYGNLRSDGNSRSYPSQSLPEDRRIDIRFIMAQPKALQKELYTGSKHE